MQKCQQVFHINLLKKWEIPRSDNFVAEEVEDDFPDWKGEVQAQPTIGSRLSPGERKDVVTIFKEFQDVLQSQPKKTNLTKHKIITKTDRPVKLPAYRLIVNCPEGA